VEVGGPVMWSVTEWSRVDMTELGQLAEMGQGVPKWLERQAERVGANAVVGLRFTTASVLQGEPANSPTARQWW
jgi:hypothetical protein